MKERIITLLSEIKPEIDFKGSSDFITEGLLDSFDIVQLVTALDEEFGISIEGIDIVPENFSSLAGIEILLTKNGVSR